MKQKVQAVSQEAKSSAAIIGSLPFIIVLLMSFFNPKYLRPLFDLQTGHMLLIGSGLWMLIGVLVMRKMINFNCEGRGSTAMMQALTSLLQIETIITILAAFATFATVITIAAPFFENDRLGWSDQSGCHRA